MWWTGESSCDVLVVCTGNVCRSPYVAQRLAVSLPRLKVASAGTGALVGEPPASRVLSMLRDRGITTAETPARRLTKQIARGARLVITAERRHRVEVVRLAPVATDRAFTLLELTRMLQSVGSPSGLGVAGVLDVARRSLAAGDNQDHDDDLADPYGRSLEDYETMARVADDALLVVTRALEEES